MPIAAPPTLGCLSVALWLLEQVGRGLYRLANSEPLEQPDLVTISRRVPGAVVCLVSALSLHELTTQIPHAVDIAVKQGRRRPHIEHPPIRVYWWSAAALRIGVETRKFSGVEVLVTNPSGCRANRSGREGHSPVPRGALLTRPIKDLAKSVHTRLLALAKQTGRLFNEVLQLYAMERCLYRLSVSKHSPHFVLKGGLLLRVWNAPVTRPTKDIVLLGRTANTVANLVTILQAVCVEPVEPDGMQFDATTAVGSLINEDAQ